MIGGAGMEILLSPANRIWHLRGQVLTGRIIAGRWELNGLSRIHAGCPLRPLVLRPSLRTWGAGQSR